MTDIPYENTLAIEELRREVRECWDREHALMVAIRDGLDMPSPWLLRFLSRAATWPKDHNLGVTLQRQYGLDAIPPNTECELGAGVWYRIRQGLLMKEE